MCWQTVHWGERLWGCHTELALDTTTILTSSEFPRPKVRSYECDTNVTYYSFGQACDRSELRCWICEFRSVVCQRVVFCFHEIMIMTTVGLWSWFWSCCYDSSCSSSLGFDFKEAIVCSPDSNLFSWAVIIIIIIIVAINYYLFLCKGKELINRVIK